MVASTNSHHQQHQAQDERDDMLHIQTARNLLTRLVTTPVKSRIGNLIDERLAALIERIGEKLDPAKRREMTVANQDIGALGGDGASTVLGLTPKETLGIVPGITPINLTKELSAAQASLAPQEVASVAPSDLPQLGSTTEAPPTLVKNNTQNLTTGPVNASQLLWVVLLSQLLNADLKRLGVEPDELDDIRMLLIRGEAARYDKLQLLSRLPDSLAPEATTKVLEDLRTMAMAYVFFVMNERLKEQSEEERANQRPFELPHSLRNAFKGIPEIDFAPEEILKVLDG